ncbi:hypothetical protein BGX26_012170 [Mortierella sp. AD094]|nr:hypothetical protein BGX26_012170 [Mortierella sp. AD094]
MPRPLSPCFESMKELVVTRCYWGDDGVLNELITRTPALKRFSWALVYGDPFPVDEVVVLVKEARIWTTLEALELRSFGELDITDACLAVILTSLAYGQGPGGTRGLKHLSLVGTRFGRGAFLALELNQRALLRTLEWLELRDSRHREEDPRESLSELGFIDEVRKSSAMIQKIMESAPRLRVLRAEFLWVQDVVKGRPWVCSELREIDMRIQGKQDHRTTFQKSGLTEQDYDMVYRRLKELTRLENFVVTGPFSRNGKLRPRPLITPSIW